ncbi:MAG: hypothetical protein ACAI25_12535, partial [Planctomycetota bacterium]
MLGAVEHLLEGVDGVFVGRDRLDDLLVFVDRSRRVAEALVEDAAEAEAERRGFLGRFLAIGAAL